MQVAVRANWLDRAIGVFSPQAALRRSVARGALDAARAYDGAKGGRHTDGWNAPGTSGDAEVGSALPRLRDRARDLDRNNPHARKASTVWKNNLVAWGIEPRPASGNPEVDSRAAELWKEWAKYADIAGELSFQAQQELSAGLMVVGGEALLRRHWVEPSATRRVPLRIEVLEGDHLDHGRTGEVAGGRIAVQGVEFDGRQRVGYWLHQNHPGNNFTATLFRSDSQRVDAADVAHLYRKENRTQVRGVPWGSAVIRPTRDLGDYEFAEIVRKKSEACVVAIVIDGDEEGVNPQHAGNAQVVDGKGNLIESFKPGMIGYARGGKDVRFNNPTGPGGYVEYRKAGLQTISAGFCVPYELLTGDLSQVNFSSARVGLVEFRRLVETVQWLTIIPMALDRVWEWFCEAAHLAGLLPVPVVPVEWDPPEFESVNPIDDANADLIKVRSGAMTLYELIGKRGRDPKKVFAEHAEIAALLDELKLTFDSDARKTSRAGLTQARPAGSELPGLDGPSEQAKEAAERGDLRPVT